MSDDDIDDDDLNAADDDGESDDLPEVDSDTSGDDDGDEPAVKTRKKAATAEDLLEGLSIEAKAREREMLARQMEEFMARGGKIQEVDPNVVGDPPRKPDSKYGSRPI
ncbi:hypothetical protein [Halopseudomonas pelagia]|uniref:Transcriptional regulator SutA RNAP-binding domain-containing protein n=1 Tax=Halopseudomonas pelagia TaxID=553151 RepID=A0AA91U2S0_9GAMM|nr:hypothetical protein [Halopseudomonas pelagia]PCC99665.1 hypothetical protein CO192_09445 [Halopseudomonas pelagia]QFY54942.1 hypothetical protein EAO82_00190 [Halopseudomonas pelagia]